MNHSESSATLFGTVCTCVCVCGRECLRLLRLGLLLNINKDFLPTRQSQTPDHLPGEDMPTHPSEPGSLPPLISIGLCALAAHQSKCSLAGHPHTNHVFSPTPRECVWEHAFFFFLFCVNVQDLDILGGDYIQGRQGKKYPPFSNTHLFKKKKKKKWQLCPPPQW